VSANVASLSDRPFVQLGAGVELVCSCCVLVQSIVGSGSVVGIVGACAVDGLLSQMLPVLIVQPDVIVGWVLLFVQPPAICAVLTRAGDPDDDPIVEDWRSQTQPKTRTSEADVEIEAVFVKQRSPATYSGAVMATPWPRVRSHPPLAGAPA
jgi:hypothetical protein